MKTARDEKVIEQIRQNILDAALDIIISDGFHAFTMRRLASSLKMTAPNIYNYFSNKDEIYISIVIRGFKILQGLLENCYQQFDTPLKRVRAMADAYMEFGLSNPLYYNIMFVSSTPKHLDYIGTPLEHLSEVEYNLSMEILDLVLKSSSELSEEVYSGNTRAKATPLSHELAKNKMIQIWSMLHGMIALHNSSITPYVMEHPNQTFSDIIDDVFSLFVEIT